MRMPVPDFVRAALPVRWPGPAKVKAAAEPKPAAGEAPKPAEVPAAPGAAPAGAP